MLKYKKHFPINIVDIKENEVEINIYNTNGIIPTLSHNAGKVNKPVPSAVDRSYNTA